MALYIMLIYHPVYISPSHAIYINRRGIITIAPRFIYLFDLYCTRCSRIFHLYHGGQHNGGRELDTAGGNPRPIGQRRSKVAFLIGHIKLLLLNNTQYGNFIGQLLSDHPLRFTLTRLAVKSSYRCNTTKQTC